jgi:hypothetical protein
MITLKLRPEQAAALLYTTDVNIAATRESLATLIRSEDQALEGACAALEAALDELGKIRWEIGEAIRRSSDG